MTVKRSGSVAAPLALVLVASSCIGGGGDRSVLLVAKIAGAVQARVVGGDWAPASPGQKLGSGDRVRVASGGSVTLERGKDSVVEVRPNSSAPAELAVAEVDLLSLLSGDVLVASSRAAPVAVESGGIEAAGGGDVVFRFDRRLSVRVGVYEGAASIEAAGSTLPVPELREGIVSARLLPRETRPLALNPADPWDLRFLGDVIELDAELEAQHRGYEAAFGRTTSVAALERHFRAALALGRLRFASPFLSSSSHGDVLTGLVLTALVVQRDGSGAATTFERIMTVREQGASWGLVVRSVGVDGQALLDALVRAIGLRTGEVEPKPGVISSGSGGGGSGGSGGGGGGGGDPTPRPSNTRSPRPSPSPSQSPSPDPSPSPSESPSPEPSPTCILPPPLCNPPGGL